MPDKAQLAYLEPDDWQRYRDIPLLAPRTDPEAFYPTAEDSERFGEKQWRRRLSQPKSATMIVSDATGEDVGLAAALPYSEVDAQPGDFQLVAMWVAPRARRTGVSKLLIEAAIAHAHD